MEQEQTPTVMTSVMIAIVWTLCGLGGAAMFALFLIFMSSGGQSTPNDYRAVPLMMTLTVTPLVTGFGWIPVVRARHKGGSSGKAAIMMVLIGAAVMMLNTILLPISMVIQR